MSRSRRRNNSDRPGTPTHTSAEWAFKRTVVLTCPAAGHRLGQLSEDTVRRSLRPSSAARAAGAVLCFDGPREDPERTLRWACWRCDRAARLPGTAVARSGRPQRHEGKLRTEGLNAVLAAMASHGPEQVTVRLDHDDVAALLARVTNGEQLAAARAFERARIQRRHPSGQPPSDRPGESWWQEPGSPT